MSREYFRKISAVLLTVIILIPFILQAVHQMQTISFNVFDEAHRAETAKQMRIYQSFFVPITGSSYDRSINLRRQSQTNPFIFLYYHLERPPLVYMAMIISTYFFGISNEFSYRLPSFIFGMSTFAVFTFFAFKLLKPFSLPAFCIGILCLIGSSDLWLSAMYAQLDTAITLFLTLGILGLITYVEKKEILYLFLSGVGFALAILSKGQPAIIFILPLLYLFMRRRIASHELIKILAITSPFLLIWIVYLWYSFGLSNFINSFFGFALTSAAIGEIHHEAPIYWYIRWWWESLRPGWTLFLSLFLYDLFHKKFTLSQKIMLSYTLGSLFILSLPTSKLWWYTLPLIPTICFYIASSLTNYFKEKNHIFNIALIFLLASTPLFLNLSNIQTLFYGITTIIISVYLLNREFSIPKKLLFYTPFLLFITLALHLFWFYQRFPVISPYHPTSKTISQIYKNLPNPKCLWTVDMPQESILFYSEAEEVYLLTEGSQLFGHCSNYLITPEEFPTHKKIIQQGDLNLYSLNN